MKRIDFSQFDNLQLIVNFSEQFDLWFNTAEIDYENESGALAQYCPAHFDKWFDAEKFNFSYRWVLVIYCSKHSEKWNNRNKL